MQKILLLFRFRLSCSSSTRLRIGLLLLAATMIESCGNSNKKTTSNTDSTKTDSTTIIKTCYVPSMEEKIRHSDTSINEINNPRPQTNSPVMCYDVAVENDSAYRVE